MHCFNRTELIPSLNQENGDMITFKGFTFISIFTQHDKHLLGFSEEDAKVSAM